MQWLALLRAVLKLWNSEPFQEFLVVLKDVFGDLMDMARMEEKDEESLPPPAVV